MKIIAVACLLLSAGLNLSMAATATASAPATKAAANPAASGVAKDLAGLIGRINQKLKTGNRSEEGLAPELKEFDVILAAHKGEDPEALAQVDLAKAMLYIQVLNNFDRGVSLLAKLKADFPVQAQAMQVDGMMGELKERQEDARIQQTLKPGSPFPDFAEKDITGSALSISQFKGKVVLVDFWATWCGPCMEELPNVRVLYEKYHAKGFEIVGISLDEKESTLKDFIKVSRIGWPQYFDGQGWQSKLVKQYGVTAIPATFLLDRTGKIVSRNVRGVALEAAIAEMFPQK